MFQWGYLFSALLKSANAGFTRNPRNKETLTARSPLLNGCAYTSCIQLGKKTHPVEYGFAVDRKSIQPQ